MADPVDLKSPVRKRVKKLAEKPRPKVAQKIAEGKRVVLEALEAGYSFLGAAGRAKITRVTAWNWRDADPEFAEACQDAIMVAVAAREAILLEGSREKDWRNAAWWLEKRAPDIYGKNVGFGSRPATNQNGGATSPDEPGVTPKRIEFSIVEKEGGSDEPPRLRAIEGGKG